MNKHMLWEMLGWGFLLWLFGYILGFVFYFIVPSSQIGWYLLPIGTLYTYLVLHKKIKKNTLFYFVKLGIAWSLIAIVCDYFFLVNVLKPADGYYKLDVYVYYFITFILPCIIGWFKKFVDEI